jgi:signal transduction histidine kinase
MERLALRVRENERWLMERILSYARAQGFTKYTSTLVEAWRMSIQGLSDALIQAVDLYDGELPEFSPEELFEDDPVAQFGVIEARRHRERGVSLSMFLGLYKYYRYAFVDLVREMDVEPETMRHFERFVERCFDRIEIAFCKQWSGLDSDKAIVELQRSNRLMTNEKNKYLTLFESLDLPALLVDEEGRLDNVNAPGAKILGLRETAGAMYYAPDPGAEGGACRKRLADILPWLKDALERLLEGEERSFQREVEESAEGKLRCFVATLSRMRDVSGKFRGGVVVLEDVTERREMERLKEDVERITRHDLKAPLSSMLGVCNVLLENESLSEEDKRRLLGLARDSGYKMLGLINRSLEILKMEMGTYSFEPERVDLGAVLRRVVDHLQSLAKERGVTFSVNNGGGRLEAASPGPFVQAEELLAYSAFSNLLVNALEASPQGGDVGVEIQLNGKCSVAIINQGEAPQEIRDVFFEKYVTFGKKKGTGLGTYSARLFIETMNGEIAMASGDGCTEITVKLPLAFG